ncbi:MAG: iron-containing alcohol dehydrogenase, partial [Nitratireductor sp.]
GLPNALVLPHVLRFNAPEAAGLYAEIATDAFPDLAHEEGTQGRCSGFIEALTALSKRLGLPAQLRDVGIGDEHLAKMAADAMKQTRLLVNNPRALCEADALAIYRAAW